MGTRMEDLASLPFDVLALKLAEAKERNNRLGSELHQLHTELTQVCTCARGLRNPWSSACTHFQLPCILRSER